GSRFGVENPHLEVEQIREASLDPHVVAWRIARSLEKGAYFKRVANITMQRVVQAGAKGVEIRLGGKLPSARSKTWIFTSGKLRKCGQDAIDQVQIAYAKAMTRPGVIGVKVSILAPDATFSDEITFRVEPEKKEVKRVIETVEIKEEEQPLEIPAGTPETPKDVEPEVEPIVEVSTESTEVVNEETPVEKPVEESKKVVDEKIQDNKKTPTEK
ncbi:MAG: 30S ribosomal protein S3, partial [Candidatus Altiarchaeota archaeon]|nr:30S ribosomal protein S3 [Candidatus Altiarchaeota archaeon]